MEHASSARVSNCIRNLAIGVERPWNKTAGRLQQLLQLIHAHSLISHHHPAIQPLNPIVSNRLEARTTTMSKPSGSSAILRTLRIKTSSLGRLQKDVTVYTAETTAAQQTVEKYRNSDPKDRDENWEWNIKNAEKVVKDCQQMIPLTEEKVQAVLEELADMVVSRRVSWCTDAEECFRIHSGRKATSKFLPRTSTPQHAKPSKPLKVVPTDNSVPIHRAQDVVKNRVWPRPRLGSLADAL